MIRPNIREWFSSGVLPPRRLFVRLLSALAAVVLILFHADLLVRRVQDGSLLDPVVGVQWFGALGLLALAVYFSRRQISLGSGRKALAFWLLVLVLHALPGAPASLDASPLTAPAPVPLALLLPALLIASVIAAALGGHGTLLRPAPILRSRRDADRAPRPRRGTSRPWFERGPPA